ncbi:MAG TPA: hypothetical protein VJG67_03860 [Candidatus Paceibacterota bacterium]
MNELGGELLLIKITDVFIQEIALIEFGAYLTDEEIGDIQLEIAAKLREYIKNAIKEVGTYNGLIRKNKTILCSDMYHRKNL